MLYMFRTIISPSSGASFNKLYWYSLKNKDYSQEFVHLVGLYTHCNMMHCTYNVKVTSCINVVTLHYFHCVFHIYFNWPDEGL